MTRWLMTLALAGAVAAGCGTAQDREPGPGGLSANEPPPAKRPGADLKTDAYAALLEAVASGQPPLQCLAAETFLDAEQLPQRNQFEPLADVSDPRVRTTVVALLGMTRSPALMPLLRRKQKDAEPTVRLAAAFGLAMTGDPSQVTALRDALAAPDVTQRRTAAWLLGLMGNSSAVGMLRVKLDDPDAIVVLRTAEAMHRLGSNDGLDVVRALTENERHQIRYYATRLLGHMGTTADVPRLERLYQSRYLDVKFASVAALAELGDLKRIEVLLEMVDAPDAPTRALAARELGETGYTPALERLASLLGRSDPLERTTAAAAIVRISSAKTSWRSRLLVDQPPPPLPGDTGVIPKAGTGPATPGSAR